MKLKALFYRLISPGYGHCECCGMPWNHCKEHTVWISEHDGVFAVCEKCWNECTTDEILEAHRKLWKQWEDEHCLPAINFSLDKMLNKVIDERAK